MKTPPTVPRGWAPGKFWGVVAALCLVQAGLILLFAGRSRELNPVVPPAEAVRIIGTPLTAGELTRMFFATDPTVFPLPSKHGFSDEGWLRLPMLDFDVAPEREPPAWLALDTNRLGAGLQSITGHNALLPFPLMDRGMSEYEPWPLLSAPADARTQSLFEIQGPLATRQINAPTLLPAETNSQLLSNSIVQIAVDPAGQVVAAHLLDRSGSADVDAKALNIANQLRFRPMPTEPTVWADAVFAWQTAEPTNTAAASTP